MEFICILYRSLYLNALSRHLFNFVINIAVELNGFLLSKSYRNLQSNVYFIMK